MSNINIVVPRNFQNWISEQVGHISEYVIKVIDMDGVLSFDNDHHAWSGRSHVRSIRDSFIGRYLRSGDPEYLDNAIFCYNLFKETPVRSHEEAAGRVAALERSLIVNGYPFGGEYIFTAHAAGTDGPRVVVDGKHRAAILLNRGIRRLPCVDIAVRPGAPFHAALTELAHALAKRTRAQG